MKIGIVGSGPSAIAVYLELVREFHRVTEVISLFDNKGLLSSAAFNTNEDLYLTNTSVGVTSIVGSDAPDFLHWLNSSTNCKGCTAESFVPRSLFRRYALDRFNAARMFQQSFGGQTLLIAEKVVDVVQAGNSRWKIHTDKATYKNYDIVILATGCLLGNPYPEFASHPRFVANPYESDRLQQLARESRKVLILGSKLSAIDMAKVVLSQSRSASIDMISESGELPSVRDQLLIYSSGDFSASRIKTSSSRIGLRDIFVAVARDLKRLNQGNGQSIQKLATPLDVLDRLQSEISSCLEGRNRWQLAMGYMIEEANDIWPELSRNNRTRLIQKFRGFIDRYISAMPLQNARILQMAMTGGRLEVHKRENLENLHKKDDRRFSCKLYGKDHSFDLVLNATGMDYSTISAQKLYRNMNERANVISETGGISVDPATMRLSAYAQSVSLYAMGSPVTGSLLVTNYVRSSVVQARRIVRDIKQHFPVTYEINGIQDHVVNLQSLQEVSG